MTEVITIENNLRLSNSSSGPALQTIQLKDDPQIRSAGGLYSGGICGGCGVVGVRVKRHVD